jgi:hypothetical protein
MNNVALKDLEVGKEYVFGKESDVLGFVPTTCNSRYVGDVGGDCRIRVAKIGRKYFKAVGFGNDNFNGEGAFEISTAKKLYREALEKRERAIAPRSILSAEEIDALVEAL